MHMCRIADIHSGILSQLFKTSKVWHWCLSVNYNQVKITYTERIHRSLTILLESGKSSKSLLQQFPLMEV